MKQHSICFACLTKLAFQYCLLQFGKNRLYAKKGWRFTAKKIFCQVWVNISEEDRDVTQFISEHQDTFSIYFIIRYAYK